MSEITDLPYDETSTQVPSTPHHITIFFWTILVLIWTVAAATFLGNILVLLAFVLDRKLRKVNFNLYILNLAITDVVVSFVVIPLFTIDVYHGGWPYNQVTCALWILLDWGMTFGSIFTLVAISVDRYWAACWPKSYRKLNLTRFRTLMAIAAVWFCLIVIWVPAWLKDRLTNSKPGVCIWSVDHNREYAMFIAVAGYHGPSFFMIFCYVKVYRVMSKNGAGFRRKVAPSGASFEHSTAVSTIRNDALSKQDNVTLSTMDGQGYSQNIVYQRKQSQMAKERRIFVSLSYIMVAYLISWSPFQIIVDVMYFNPNVVSFEWYCLSALLVFCNSMFNPIIYAASSNDFRTSFKRILTCKMFKSAN